MEINVEVIDNTIIIFDGVLRQESCVAIIDEIKDKGTFKQTVEKKEEVYISREPKLKQLDILLFKLFNQAAQHYLNVTCKRAFGDNYQAAQNFIIQEDDGYICIKYTESGYDAPHYDQITNFNKTKPIRLLSAVLYLNENFEGGESEFFYQKYKVQPKAGRLVMFPSTLTHPHQVCPVQNGEKYVIETWFH